MHHSFRCIHVITSRKLLLKQSQPSIIKVIPRSMKKDSQPCHHQKIYAIYYEKCLKSSRYKTKIRKSNITVESR